MKINNTILLLNKKIEKIKKSLIRIFNLKSYFNKECINTEANFSYN